MKRMFKLFALAGAVYGVISLVRHLRGRAETHHEVTPPVRGAAIDPDTLVGISDVDPTGISQMVEAVDPDAIGAAHNAIEDQRDRMPVAGKNLP